MSNTNNQYDAAEYRDYGGGRYYQSNLSRYGSPFQYGYVITDTLRYRSSVDRWHCGVDLVPKDGSSAPVVLATMAGKVVQAGPNKSTSMGNTVVINHSYDNCQSIYMHLDSWKVKVGDYVPKGYPIGIMGNTGIGTGPHLHYQLMKEQGTGQVAVQVYKNPQNVWNPIAFLEPERAGQEDEYLWAATREHLNDETTRNRFAQQKEHGMFPLSPYYNGYSERRMNLGGEIIDDIMAGNYGTDAFGYMTSDYAVASRKLLEPTDDERKYGPSIYSGVQNLVRNSTSGGVSNSSDAEEALKRYAVFLYNLINSRVTTASMQCVSMPQIRPGFNVWVDPNFIDRVYYVDSVTHSGNPSSGVYTSLGLSMGRDRKAFTSGDIFGGLRPGTSDNVFLNTIDIGVKVFSDQLLTSESDFNNEKKRIDNYYSQNDINVKKAIENKLLVHLYDTNDHEPSNDLGDKMTGGEYDSVDDIQRKLDSMYAKAPEVVRDRVTHLRKVISKSEEFITKHYNKK